MQLAGKTALVTGGGRRIGAEIVRHLARAGARVYLHYRNSKQDAEALADALRAERADVRPVHADLARPADIDALFDMIDAEGNGLDLLVANAGVYARGSLAGTTLETWEGCFAVNLAAAFHCAKRAAPLMEARGAGCIVHVADIAGERAWPNHAAYCCSQAGLLMLTRVLALELAPRVRVNAVLPGTVLWPDDMGKEARTRITSRIPMRRTGRPADVAAAVRFLLEQPFVTGETIRVDGGRGIVP